MALIWKCEKCGQNVTTAAKDAHKPHPGCIPVSERMQKELMEGPPESDEIKKEIERLKREEEKLRERRLELESELDSRKIGKAI